MPQLTLPASADGLPLTRRDIEQHVDALIDLLDTLDADPDLEPDLGSGDDREGDDPDLEDGADSEPALGWTGASCSPENQSQDGPAFCLNADAGRDLEDEHDGREPDVDGEASLGWRNEGGQTGQWSGNPLVGTDFEDGVGPVRKPRPASKTGGAVYHGAAVLGLKEPPQNPRTFTMPMARPKRRAAR